MDSTRPGAGSRPRSASNPPARWLGLALATLLALGARAGPVQAEDPAAEVARLRSALAAKDREIDRLKAALSTRPGPEPAPPPAPPSPAPVIIEPDAPALPPPADPATGPTSRLFDNLAIAVGIDGSKQPQDFGVNALFGGRFEVNWGVPLIESRGIGLQVGTSINGSLNAVGVFERIQGTKNRLQNFSTVGLFGRGDRGLTWAVGHDFLYEQYYGDFHLGQWRGTLAYQVDQANEFGGRLMLRSYGSAGHFGSIPIALNPIDMGLLTWRHRWTAGPSTTFWAGLADGHHTPNAALGDSNAILRHPFVFGAEVEAPLNDHAILFGQANFITPPSSGTVDAFLGIVVYPFDAARRERSRRSRPVLSVANNPTMAVDLARRR